MKMICVGRNYAQHARELQNDLPTEPVLFLKPETALVAGTEVRIPDFTQDLHYECELVLRIGRKAQNIEVQEALSCVDALTLGIDFTARDLQEQLKNKKLPWERAKAFDNSAVAGDFKPIGDFPDLSRLRFELQKNGQTVQVGQPSEMIFSIPELLAYASRYFTLMPGDLVFTGTPAGVGPVQPGDRLTGFLNQEAVFEVRIAS